MFFGLNKRAAVVIEFPDTGESFDIDCTFSIDHSRSATVTSFPTGRGSTISDHRDRNPVMLTVSGMMSDVHPSRGPNPISLALGIGNNTLHRDFRDRMIEADENDEEITIDLGERGRFGRTADYTYLIESLSLPNEPENGKAVYFSVTIKQVKLVQARIENLVAPRIARLRLEAETEAIKNKTLGATKVSGLTEVQRFSQTTRHGLAGASSASSSVASAATAVSSIF